MTTLCFGEILLRLSPPDAQRLVQARQFGVVFGGSEANVAVSLSQWGVPAAYLTRVPAHELGDAALSTVRQFGVDTSRAVRGGERLGVYFLEQGVGRRASKVVYDRAHSGMATLVPGLIDWRAVLQNVGWLHWSGITPALSESATEALFEGLQAARRLGVRVSCDLNYRANLWQGESQPGTVFPELVDLTDVLLGDATAFDLCLGVKMPDETPPAALLEAVKTAFPHLSHVAMTRREGHSATHNTYQGVLLDSEGTTRFSQVYDLPDLLDRIGTGDALVAGLIYGLQKGFGTQETVEFAAAAGAFKHYVAGDFNLCTEAEVRALMGGSTGGRVQR